MNFWQLHVIPLLLCLIWFAWGVTRRTIPSIRLHHLGVAFLFGYIALTVFWPPNPGPLKLAAAQVFMLALIPLTVCYSIPKKSKLIVYAIGGLLAFDAVYLLLGGKGMMTGKSFDAAIMAVCLPLWLIPWRQINAWALRIGLILNLICIFAFGGSTTFLILAAQCIVAFRYRKNYWWDLLPIPFFLLWFWWLDPSFMKSDSRLLMWANYMDFWLKHANPFIGLGPGSFEVLGPGIQLTNEKLRYVWMHNDWLQILFEYGLIGLSFSLVTLWQVYRRLSYNIFGQTFVMGLAICMFFYSPLRFAFMQFLTVAMIVEAYAQSSKR